MLGPWALCTLALGPSAYPNRAQTGAGTSKKVDVKEFIYVQRATLMRLRVWHSMPCTLSPVALRLEKNYCTYRCKLAVLNNTGKLPELHIYLLPLCRGKPDVRIGCCDLSKEGSGRHLL